VQPLYAGLAGSRFYVCLIIDSVADDVFHSVDPDFHKQNIHDCFKLGKFKEDTTCP